MKPTKNKEITFDLSEDDQKVKENAFNFDQIQVNPFHFENELESFINKTKTDKNNDRGDDVIDFTILDNQTEQIDIMEQLNDFQFEPVNVKVEINSKDEHKDESRLEGSEVIVQIDEHDFPEIEEDKVEAEIGKTAQFANISSPVGKTKTANFFVEKEENKFESFVAEGHRALVMDYKPRVLNSERKETLCHFYTHHSKKGSEVTDDLFPNIRMNDRRLALERDFILRDNWLLDNAQKEYFIEEGFAYFDLFDQPVDFYTKKAALLEAKISYVEIENGKKELGEESFVDATAVYLLFEDSSISRFDELKDIYSYSRPVKTDGNSFFLSLIFGYIEEAVLDSNYDMLNMLMVEMAKDADETLVVLVFSIVKSAISMKDQRSALLVLINAFNLTDLREVFT